MQSDKRVQHVQTRIALPCRDPQEHALRLCLWRRRRLCGPAALQPAGTQQRIRSRESAARHQRGPCPRQAVLCGGQHSAPQLQAQDLHPRHAPCSGYEAGCTHHVRSRSHHDDARSLPRHAYPSLGAGQRGQLGHGEVLASDGTDPCHPIPRAVSRRDRGDPHAGAGDGTGSLRPRGAVHGLLRPLPALRLHQQA